MSKVLIVDDDKLHLVMLQEVLEFNKYNVISASNGEEALEKARTDSPDIIISDILMPVMDGFTLCHKWKNDSLLQKIPFIICSSEYTDEKDEKDEKDEVFASKLGVDRFIRKPIMPDKLIEILQDVLNDIEQGTQEAGKPVIKTNNDVFKLYNESLISKLEQKMIDLERTMDALKESEALLRALTGRLTEVEEMERKRLAQELHDKVGPNLTALNINLCIINDELPDGVKEDVRSRLNDSSALLEETAEFIRDIMAKLRPHVLDDYGLVAALNWYCESFSKRTGISVEVHDGEHESRLPQEMETALYRVAQEAMTNVVKHANADRIIINIEKTNRDIRFVIDDNGAGFNTAGIESWKQSGWGILNMRERVQALGGQFLIKSSPGKGTHVEIELAI